MNIRSICQSAIITFLWCVARAYASGEPAADSSVEPLALACEIDGLTSTKMSSHVRVTPGPPIEVREGYVIKTFNRGDDSGNIVVFLEKGPIEPETARITKICLNKKDHASQTTIPGTIEFLSHLGKPLNIRFHLDKKNNDDGYLAQTTWKSPARMSLGVSDAAIGEQQPPKPSVGQLPGCLPPSKIKGGGKHADLSFDFGQCLTQGQGDIRYAYNLFFDRHNLDGSVTPYSLDPQIINHGH